MGTYFPVLQVGLVSKALAIPHRAFRDARGGAILGRWLRLAANFLVATVALWVILANAADRWRVAQRELTAAKSNSAVLITPTFPPHVDAPFFTIEAFRLLRPGMTEVEVRDRIGYPLRRLTAGADNVVWNYSLPLQDSLPYPHFSVLFDTRTGRLVRTNEIPLVYMGCSDSEVWTVRTDENSTRFDALKHLSKNTFLLFDRAVMVMAQDAAQAEAAANTLRQRLSSLGLQDLPIVPCVADDETPLDPMRHRDAQLIVVCKEGLFALPTPCQKETLPACEADVDWALVRLLGGAKATKSALDTAN